MSVAQLNDQDILLKSLENRWIFQQAAVGWIELVLKEKMAGTTKGDLMAVANYFLNTFLIILKSLRRLKLTTIGPPLRVASQYLPISCTNIHKSKTQKFDF